MCFVAAWFSKRAESECIKGVLSQFIQNYLYFEFLVLALVDMLEIRAS